MSSIDENIFYRLQYIVDEIFDGNRSKFSKDLNLSRNYMNGIEKKLEAGKEPNPGYSILSSLVERHGVNPVWLLTGKGEPFSRTNEKEILGMAKDEEEKELINRVLQHYKTLKELAGNGKHRGSLLLAFRDQLQSQIKQSESLVNLIGLIEFD